MSAVATTPATLEPVLIDGPALAHVLGVSPGTIRNWASACSRGGYDGPPLRARGKDDRGRALYDLDEAQAFAATRGIGPEVDIQASSGAR